MPRDVPLREWKSGQARNLSKRDRMRAFEHIVARPADRALDMKLPRTERGSGGDVMELGFRLTLGLGTGGRGLRAKEGLEES